MRNLTRTVSNSKISSTQRSFDKTQNKHNTSEIPFAH